MIKTVVCRGTVHVKFDVDVPLDHPPPGVVSPQAFVDYIEDTVRQAIAAQAAVEFDHTDMNWTFK